MRKGNEIFSGLRDYNLTPFPLCSQIIILTSSSSLGKDTFKQLGLKEGKEMRTGKCFVLKILYFLASKPTAHWTQFQVQKMRILILWQTSKWKLGCY